MTLELECFNRLYLNACVPLLPTGAGTACFFREVRGNPVPSSALMVPMTRRFTENLERFARDRGADVVTFRKGKRKEDVTQGRLWNRRDGEGVLCIGKAPASSSSVRTFRTTPSFESTGTSTLSGSWRSARFRLRLSTTGS